MKPGSDILQLCLTVNAGLCYDAAPPADPSDGSGVDPAALAVCAVAQLTVPGPQIILSPHPSDNKWNVSAVGLPIWVSSDSPSVVSTTASEQGIDILMTAKRGSVRFDWGDGTSTVCSVMRPRPGGTDPLVASPDWRLTYLRAGDHTVIATAGWAVYWQALGQCGVLPLTSAASTQVPVREFESVVIG